jgi:peptidoglycan/xylan/chitin deacetylase (PgdA/CDA1 family)
MKKNAFFFTLIAALLVIASLGFYKLSGARPVSSSQQSISAPYYIDKSKPMVAITFDDGPSNITLRIIETLAKYNSKATFCMLGNRIETREATVKAVYDQGSEIIGHTWNHKQLTLLSSGQITKQLQDTNDAIAKVTGEAPKLYRPAFGLIDQKVQAVSKKLGLAIILWSVDTMDWNATNADTVYRSIMKNVEDGSIILCHDMYSTTADAMERVIPDLIEQGYQLVTVSELLYYSEETIEAGNSYSHR